MFNNAFLEDLSSRLSALMPMADEAREELRTKMEQLIKNSVAGLDLLSREEFDAGRAALHRGEKRISELEATITELSARLDTFEEQSSDN